MSTTETEQVRDEPAQLPAEPTGPAAVTEAAPNPSAVVMARLAETTRTDVAEQLRAEFAEVASVATQAARLGVQIDAADAVRKGISAETLRRTVLDTLASRADATTVITAAPSAVAAGDSPIVRRAKERAATAARN
jgi:hypothetical protein